MNISEIITSKIVENNQGDKQVDRVAEFEKVSFDRFYTDIAARAPHLAEEEVQAIYDAIELPTRATAGSMGYDFKAPIDFSISEGDTLEIPTGVRVRVDDGWGLMCFPRSGLGFKYGVRIANTVGIIDSDYYNAKNEGHIIIKLENGKIKPLEIPAGKGFVQGVFLPYGITCSDNVGEERMGGFGSTDSGLNER